MKFFLLLFQVFGRWASIWWAMTVRQWACTNTSTLNLKHLGVIQPSLISLFTPVVFLLLHDNVSAIKTHIQHRHWKVLLRCIITSQSHTKGKSQPWFCYVRQVKAWSHEASFMTDSHYRNPAKKNQLSLSQIKKNHPPLCCSLMPPGGRLTHRHPWLCCDLWPLSSSLLISQCRDWRLFWLI